MAGLEEHLPGLVPWLINALADPKVRQCCILGCRSSYRVEGTKAQQQLTKAVSRTVHHLLDAWPILFLDRASLAARQEPVLYSCHGGCRFSSLPNTHGLANDPIKPSDNTLSLCRASQIAQTDV
jgi:hypothetical protein